MKKTESVRGSGFEVRGNRKVTPNSQLQTPNYFILALLLFTAPMGAWAADYCSQLEALGLEGKHVAVTSSLGSAAETREGKLVAIEPGTLILNPAPEPDGIQPLYEGSKIVEPLKTRVYLNCNYIVSVTVDPMPLTR